MGIQELAVDVSLAQDGGIMKRIIEEGAGDTPTPGNEVEVHYVGRLLDGNVFDSSRARNEHFKFKVGTGQVIKGWDEGIVTMKRGEVAILTCTAEYAYGPAGSPPKIPPNATLDFEVEMFDFFGEDCSPDHSGGVTKTTTVPGSGKSTPREGSTVNVSWKAKHMDRDIETRTLKFILGDGGEEGVVPGVEAALLKMKKGETAKVHVKAQYAYANQGDAGLAVPGAADLDYELTLEDFEQAKYKYEMSGKEKVEFCEKVKEMGTGYFKKAQFELAVKKYQQIVEYLEDEDSASFSGDSDDEIKEPAAEKEKEEVDEAKTQSLLLAAHSNQALCYLKLSKGLEAAKACEAALKLDPQNVKALFRRGQASEQQQEYEQAVGHFQAVLAVEPKNGAAAQQIRVCQNQAKKFKAAQKKRYANMFERTNFKEPEPTKDENKLKPDFSDSEGEGSEEGEEPVEEAKVEMQAV